MAIWKSNFPTNQKFEKTFTMLLNPGNGFFSKKLSGDRSAGEVSSARGRRQFSGGQKYDNICLTSQTGRCPTQTNFNIWRLGQQTGPGHPQSGSFTTRRGASHMQGILHSAASMNITNLTLSTSTGASTGVGDGGFSGGDCMCFWAPAHLHTCLWPSATSLACVL